MIIGIHICQVKTMCRMQELMLTLSYPFGLSPLNKLYRGKFVSSIIVNIPYLLDLTLSIISSNIYTILAVCNCLSFTLRLGDLPSLLMAFFLKRLLFIFTICNDSCFVWKMFTLRHLHIIRISTSLYFCRVINIIFIISFVSSKLKSM